MSPALAPSQLTGPFFLHPAALATLNSVVNKSRGRIRPGGPLPGPHAGDYVNTALEACTRVHQSSKLKTGVLRCCPDFSALCIQIAVIMPGNSVLETNCNFYTFCSLHSATRIFFCAPESIFYPSFNVLLIRNFLSGQPPHT